MDSTRSTPSGAAAAVAPARTAVPVATELRPAVRSARTTAATTVATARQVGYGLPCTKCRCYYPANLTACPICKTTERVSPKVAAVKVNVISDTPSEAVLDEERERFLREFKAKLYAAHTQINPAGQQRCANAEEGDQAHEQASLCKACYGRVQQRTDQVEAALHMNLQEATQIIYDAVWADASDKSKTYQNAAQALLSELRKRAGIDLVMGTLQALPH